MRAAWGEREPVLSPPGLRRPGFDAHQVNCTYLSACDGDAYLAARAIQLWAPGIPQV